MLEIPGGGDTTTATCEPSAGSWNTERGAKWIVGNYGNTLYNHAETPNTGGHGCMNTTQQKGRLAARSLHSGGVSVLSCDGSVRFVRDGVPASAWQALATRTGGEPFGSESPRPPQLRSLLTRTESCFATANGDAPSVV
jgi:hypothetical protein